MSQSFSVSEFWEKNSTTVTTVVVGSVFALAGGWCLYNRFRYGKWPQYPCITIGVQLADPNAKVQTTKLSDENTDKSE